MKDTTVRGSFEGSLCGDLVARYQSLVRELHKTGEKPTDTMRRAASKIMRQLAAENQILFDRLNELAEGCCVQVRNYGGGQFFASPEHPRYRLNVDPWPASRYPKSVLCIELAQAINEGEVYPDNG